MLEENPDQFSISIVMVTYARDEMVKRAIARTAEIIDRRQDVEFILVDNNVDDIDRSTFLSEFAHYQYVKNGVNKGVSARSDGAERARGRIIIFLDDDAILEVDDSLALYEASFAADESLAIVGARHIDHRTGVTPREAFPHTNKALPQDKAFKTFRFQGNAFSIRREVYERVGPLPTEYFYGLEEIDYAYRIIDAGYGIFYQPKIRVIEYNDAGGRRPRKEVEEMRLSNKLVIVYKYMPWYYVPFTMIAFSAYVTMLNKGSLNVGRSFANFIKIVRSHKVKRTPIGREAQAYIRQCGGAVWR